MGPVVISLVGVAWLAMVGICMLKDKIFLAIAAFLLTAGALPVVGTTLAIVPIAAAITLLTAGTLRDAKPDSFWARRFGKRAEYTPPPPEELFR